MHTLQTAPSSMGKLHKDTLRMLSAPVELVLLLSCVSP
jgi:hypothetical protein